MHVEVKADIRFLPLWLSVFLPRDWVLVTSLLPCMDTKTKAITEERTYWRLTVSEDKYISTTADSVARGRRGPGAVVEHHEAQAHGRGWWQGG